MGQPELRDFLIDVKKIACSPTRRNRAKNLGD
jgi:hypothetical protein